jgi:hypothetical protein
MRCVDNNGCHSRAVFALPGGRPAYCQLHKTAAMVNVYRKRCAYQDGHFGCDRFAAFGLPGAGRATYCRTHKTADMIEMK